jgi:hypothetical protein
LLNDSEDQLPIDVPEDRMEDLRQKHAMEEVPTQTNIINDSEDQLSVNVPEDRTEELRQKHAMEEVPTQTNIINDPEDQLPEDVQEDKTEELSMAEVLAAMTILAAVAMTKLTTSSTETPDVKPEEPQ